MTKYRRTLATLLGAIVVAGCAAGPAGTGTPPPATPSLAAATPTAAPATPSPSATPEPLAHLVSDASIDVPGADKIFGSADRLFVQGRYSVFSIDPATLEVREPVADQGDRWGVDHGFGSLWVGHDGGDRGWVERFDAATGESIAVFETGRIPIQALAAFDAVWVGNHRTPSLTRIDPQANAVTHTIKGPLAFDPISLTASRDRIWVVSPNAYRLTGFDPTSHATVAEVTLTAQVCGVTHLLDRLWIRQCGIGDTFVHDGATGEPLGRFDGDPLLGPGGELLAARRLKEADQFALGRYDPVTLEPHEELLITGRGAFVAGDAIWTIVGNEVLRYPLEPVLD